MLAGVFKNTLILSGVQLLNILMPFLVIPYFIRAYGVDGFGRIAFAQAYIAVLLVIVDYGFSWSAVARVARKKSNNEELNSIFWGVTFSKTALLFFCVLITLIIVNVQTQFRNNSSLVFWLLLSLFGSVLQSQWYFQGVERLKILLISNFVSRLFSFLAVILLVKSSEDLEVGAAILGIGNLLGGVICALYLIRGSEVYFVKPNKKDIKNELIDGWPLFLSNVSIALYSAANLIALGMFSTNRDVGIFSVADKVKVAGQTLITPFSNAIYPRLNALLQEDKKRGMQLLRRGFLLQFSFGLTISVIIFIFSEKIIHLVAGANSIEDISNINYSLLLLSFVPWLVSMSNYFGVQIVLTFGGKLDFRRVIVFAGMMNLLALYPVSKYYGAIGVATSLLMIEILVTFMMGYFAYKVLKNEKENMDLV